MSRPRSIRRPAALTLAILAAAGVAALQAQARHPISGRAIAGVMSHEGAAWLERPERIREEQPERALDALAIPRGAIVADVGAGSGYYTVRLARRVGPSGKVYATDIQREMLALLERRVRRDDLRNVELVLGAEDDPRLPERTFDLVLLVDVYHELARPQAMLQRLRRALKPDGRLVLIEFRKEDRTVPIRYEHKMSEAEARQELEAEGYAFERNLDVLPWQHILVFRPAPPER
jgi:ubiquinone/menaquinone biosynthesis C-methylase UbiE